LSAGLSTNVADVVDAFDDVFSVAAISSRTDGDDGRVLAAGTAPVELSGGVFLVGDASPVARGGASVAVLEGALAASAVAGTGDAIVRSKFAPNIA
jgi:hypothetical protein